MKIKFGKNTSKRVVGRLKKKARIRNKISGTSERPRFSVYKSLNHIYAQIIDDTSHKTLASASSLKLDASGKKGMDLATEVGKAVAELAKEQNLTEVVFDRNGFIYHGKIKAVADAAREAGLTF
ncbi:MAG: 50S ribosomal protein L18 [Bdellovibrionales bacterium]